MMDNEHKFILASEWRERTFRNPEQAPSNSQIRTYITKGMLVGMLEPRRTWVEEGALIESEPTTSNRIPAGLISDPELKSLIEASQ